jgi:tetratricopeptide (TPR) repeat protein
MKSRQKMIVAMFVALSIFILPFGQSFAQQARSDNEISYYQQSLKRTPQNANSYFGLADALIRKARESGDPEYFNRAEAALKQALEITPRNAAALRHLAYVYYSRHEFAPAAVEAESAIALNPDDAHAYGILGDALMETGEYAKAEESYRKMIALDKSLYSYSRRAGIKYLRGDIAGSMADLTTATAIGKFSKQPAESQAWVQSQLGNDYFSQGKLAEAESQYRQALESYPDYFRANAGLAQVKAAQAHYDEAIALYRKSIAVIPMPEYIAALGEVYEKVGRTEDARKQYDLVEYIGKFSALNKVLYNRELAYFYADRNIKPAEGLALARRELDYRKDVYAYDVLAWNLFRNGEFAAAREAIDEARKLGTPDAKLFFHAGMIYERVGEKEKASKFLTRALAINPHFHILFADQAMRMLSLFDESTKVMATAQQSEAR